MALIRGVSWENVENSGLCSSISALRDRVADIATGAGRAADSVQILVAVKTQPADLIRQTVGCGVQLLGHNRVQELVATGEDLRANGLDHELHLIGPLQRNKVNHALRWATCIQTIDRVDLVDRMSDALNRLGADAEVHRRGRHRLDVMVQVNVSGEETKSGVAPDEAMALATAVGEKENLRLTGLMTIGPNTEDSAEIRRAYATLRELRDAIRDSGAPGTDTCVELSMGMTNDLPEAIAEGATIVRVGRALFGERK